MIQTGLIDRIWQQWRDLGIISSDHKLLKRTDRKQQCDIDLVQHLHDKPGYKYLPILNITNDQNNPSFYHSVINDTQRAIHFDHSNSNISLSNASNGYFDGNFDNITSASEGNFPRDAAEDIFANVGFTKDCRDSSQLGLIELDLNRTAGAFLYWLVGLGIALIVLLFEVLLTAAKNKLMNKVKQIKNKRYFKSASEITLFNKNNESRKTDARKKRRTDSEIHIKIITVNEWVRG